MKVLFVTPSFYPATYYGGPTYINYAFCNSLSRVEGVLLRVLTTDSDGPRNRVPVDSLASGFPHYQVDYCRRTLPPDISAKLLVRLLNMIRESDLVHLNGVYCFTTIPTLMLSHSLGRPVVWSPFGALQRWPGATRKAFKGLWEKMCDWFCEPRRVVLHVTSEEEQKESLRRLTRVSSVVIRNGIELPRLDLPKNSRGDHPIRLLYIGRLHPIKGIENLLRALALVKDRVKLSICGDGEASYEKLLRSMVVDLGLNGHVTFFGRVDGEAKEQQFRQADLCIVPSFKESFCTVIVESLARAVPVIASRGTPWRQIPEVGCGLWVDNEPKELSCAITQAVNMPLPEMGLRGRTWMEREYSWAAVTAEMVQQYRGLIAQG